jgi:hypothetical protein
MYEVADWSQPVAGADSRELSGSIKDGEVTDKLTTISFSRKALIYRVNLFRQSMYHLEITVLIYILYFEESFYLVVFQLGDY